jgi:hypothetical protein
MPTCVLTILLVVLAADPMKDAPLVLLANQEWYKTAAGEEKAFEGTLELNIGGGGIGKPKRFNTYRLTWTDPEGARHTRELYAPGQAQFLALQLGKRVRIVGKAVETKVEDRTYAEIWPARLEPAGKYSPDLERGILARCAWQPNAAKRQGFSLWKITNGLELARHMGIFGRDVEQPSVERLTKEMKVAALDWNKRMVVTLSAGLHAKGETLRITRVRLQDKVLTVFYHLEVPSDAVPGLGYPAETVLIDRFNGEIRVEEETPPVK